MPLSAATSSRPGEARSSVSQSKADTRPPRSSNGFAAAEIVIEASHYCGGTYVRLSFGVPTSTSLNLRAVLKAAVARSGIDVPARVAAGLTPSAKALYVAAAAQARPHDAVLYVVPADGDLEEAVADVSF